MSRFVLTINDDCTATASIDGIEQKGVTRIFVYGMPMYYEVVLKQYEYDENGKHIFQYKTNENGDEVFADEALKTKTRIITFDNKERCLT